MNSSSNLQTHDDKSQHLYQDCWQKIEIVWFNYIIGVFDLILAIIGIVSNILIIKVTRRLRQRNQYTLVTALAAFDLLISLLVMPLEGVSHLTYKFEFYFLPPIPMICQNAIWFCLTGGSIYSLFLMSLERFLSIKYPFRKIKHRHVIVAIALVSIYTVTCFLYYLLLQRIPQKQYYLFKIPKWADYFGLLMNIVLPTLSNIAIYIYISDVVKQHQIRIDSTMVGKQGAQPKTSYISGTRLYKYVMVMFCVTWAPFCIYNVLILVYRKIYETCIGETIDSLFSSISFLNSIGNAFLYSSSNIHFQKSFKKIFCCKSNGEIYESTSVGGRPSERRDQNRENDIELRNKVR
ncbi:histamine H2 receptor-like [Clytia hemisphaerica]|uniref:histamine H2 receptor-like n=1 Tax=Clytia hemisphaerica TaxID=252671 RepID=UPI0034D535A8